MNARTLCEVFGALLVLLGLAIAYWPLAVIAVGALILTICYLTEGTTNQ